MDYSAANAAFWNPIIQAGIISVVFLLAYYLREKVSFIRRGMIPAVVIEGFILLFLKSVGIVELDSMFLESITYHGIAIGFIALSLEPRKSGRGKANNFTGLKSGAIIVSSYMIQAVVGLVITIPLALTFVPKLILAAGILLPMGYGQGPGQANNIGSSYEALGFAGGRSFAMSIAATGYLCACVVGLIVTNILVKQGKVKRDATKVLAESGTSDIVNSNKGETGDWIVGQIAIVVCVYIITYLVTKGITDGIAAVSEGAAKSVNSLLWGFNFIIGSALAMAIRAILTKVDKKEDGSSRYLDGYWLSRISDIAFDIMIIAGIASIELEDISGLWIPFILMTVIGAIVTFIHLSIVCKKAYPDYYYEGLLSMYGMMTGTISSGVLLLKEVDPEMKTPAANNLVTGSSFGILLGIPQLVLIGMAPKSLNLCLIVFGIIAAYYVVLLCIIFFVGKDKKTY